jgi:hypothetical protein
LDGRRSCFEWKLHHPTAIERAWYVILLIKVFHSDHAEFSGDDTLYFAIKASKQGKKKKDHDGYLAMTIVRAHS